MPLNKKQRILAIDPGTRELGFAIMEENELIYYGVKKGLFVQNIKSSQNGEVYS